MPSGRPIDYTGRRFGKLFVLHRSDRRPANPKKRAVYWWCWCDCGTVKEVAAQEIRDGQLSCGCDAYERVAEALADPLKQAHPSEYGSWLNMLTRCRNKRRKPYKDYGGRGITVCERWTHSFAAFLSDMGPKPSPQHSIERKDNDRGYEPDNCRWATPAEQNRNKRDSRLVSFRGETLPVVVWAERFGIPRKTLWNRLFAYGWDVERALTTPLMPDAARRFPDSSRKKRHRNLTFRGETRSMKEWADLLGIPYSRLAKRIAAGWDVERALTP